MGHLLFCTETGRLKHFYGYKKPLGTVALGKIQKIDMRRPTFVK